MAKSSGLKGNPAYKRMSNPRAKASRADSWTKSKDRKVARKAAEAASAARNRSSGTSPWAEAKAARTERRRAARATSKTS